MPQIEPRCAQPSFPFLVHTRQAWKLVVTAAAFVAAGLTALYVALSGPFAAAATTFLVATTLFVLTWVTVAWGCLAIRCPRCGLRLLWEALRGQPAMQWLFWLQDMRACPRCGLEPERRDSIGPGPPL